MDARLPGNYLGLHTTQKQGKQANLTDFPCAKLADGKVCKKQS
jgi:hypothetical protein